MAKQVALVTGANKGIGRAIARQLGARGFTVWLACRDAERGERAAAEMRDGGAEARAVMLDVTDDASVRAAEAVVARESGVLDALVNNAGIALGAPATLAGDEQLDDVAAMFAVNVLGPLRVTQAFLPLLRRSAAGRVVMMSSGLGSIAGAADMAGPYWPVRYAGYSASKSALNMLTVKLAKELLADGIKVNAADPGYTATDLNGFAGYRDAEDAAAIAVHLATLGPMGPTGGFMHDGHAAQHRLPW